MRALLVIATILATGCASMDDRSILDRVEFDDDEVGCARITGNVSVNPSVFGSTDATLTVIKRKETAVDAAGNVITPTDMPEC